MSKNRSYLKIKIFVNVMVLYLFCFQKLLSLSEMQLKIVAAELVVSEFDLKQAVSCWKDIKNPETLVKAYKKKKEHQSSCNKIVVKNIKSLFDVSLNDLGIEYIKFCDKKYFEYDLFPKINENERFVLNGWLEESGILRIHDGVGITHIGLSGNKDFFVSETSYQWNLQKNNNRSYVVKKIPGRVAFIVGYSNYYYHWMHDVLGKLIMLQKSGLEYDYIYRLL